MNFKLRRDRLAERTNSHNRQQERRWRLPQRLDLFLLTVVAGCLLAAGLAGWLLAYGQKAWGLFDPPPFENVADARLLDNIRSDAAKAHGGLVGASYLPRENALYALRSGGLLHRLDLSTRLWSDSDAMTRLPGITSPFVDLSVACPGPQEAVGETCADARALFAYSKDGGLALRQNGRWQVILADSRFVGLSGSPVSDEELALAAVSGDSRWLLVATHKEGFGLFDLTTRQWKALPLALQATLSGKVGIDRPTALAAHGNTFLIGTETGLARLEVNPRNGDVQATRDTSLTGNVLDIAVGYGEALVLLEAGCPGGSCISLHRIASGGGASPLIGETAIFPQLSATDVSRALVSSDGRLVHVLGRAGVYSYDRRMRNWTQLDAAPATVFLEAPDIDGIYYASPGQVTYLPLAGKPRRIDIEGERIVSLAQSSTDGTILAQTADNATYAIGQTSRLLTPGTMALEPLDKLTRSVAAFGKVIGIGREYVLVHDPETRSYHSIAKALLADTSLFSSDARLVGTEAFLWAVTGRNANVYQLAEQQNGYSLQVAAQVALPAAVATLHPDGDDLLGVDVAGVPFRLASDGTTAVYSPLIGSELTGGDPVVDAVQKDEEVFLARSDRVNIYSQTVRGVTGTLNLRIAETLKEITLLGDTLYMLGSRGSIVLPGDETPITGSRTPVPTGSSAITDARLQDGTLYLAGPKEITAYDIASRRVSAIYSVPATLPLKLAGIHNGVPVSYDGRNAWFGGTSLSVGGAQVVTANTSGSTVVTTQRNGRTVFTTRQAMLAASISRPECFFSSPGPADVRILDAKPLPDGRSAVLTERTLWIRDEAHRRYFGYTFAASDLSPGTRLVLLGSYLVAATETRAFAIPLPALEFGDSCARAELNIANSTVELNAAQLAVSPATDAIWLLGADGSLTKWQNGKQSPVLSPRTPKGPDASKLQSADKAGETIHFGQGDQIWSYSGISRTWQSTPVATGDASPAQLDIWNTGNALVLTASKANGTTWGGTFTEGASAQLTQLRQRGFPALPFPVSDLLDVAALSDDSWAFLGQGEVAFVNQANRPDAASIHAIDLAGRRQDRRLERASGRLLVIDGNPDAPETVHVALFDPGALSKPAGSSPPPRFSTFSPEAGERFAVTETGKVVRILADGRALECPATPGPISKDNCQTVTPPAVLLNGSDIAQAYQSGQRHLMRMANGELYLLERQTRQLQRVAQNFGVIEAALENDRSLVLLDAARQLTRLVPDTGSIAPIAKDVRILRRLGALETVQTGGSAFGLRNGEPLSREETFEALTGKKPQGTLKTFDLAGAEIAAAVETGDGYELARLSAGRLTFDPLLRFTGGPALTRDLRQVLPLDGDEWLIREADRILRIARHSCWSENPLQGEAPQAGDPDTVLELPVAPAETEQDPQTPTQAAAEARPIPQVSIVPPAKPSRVDCVAVRQVYRLPASLGASPILEAGPSPDRLVIDGRELTAEACKDTPFTYDDGDRLVSGRPAVPLCELADPGEPATPMLDTRLLEDVREALVERIDAATRQLDPTSFFKNRRPISLLIGDISLKSWRGSTLREPLPAMSAGWIAWQRETRTFAFADAAGRTFPVPPGEAMPNGRFAFAQPGIAVMSGPKDYIVVNGHGVWGYSLDAPDRLSWTRASLPTDATAVGRGRVFFANGDSIGAGESSTSRTPDSHSFELGKLRVTANLQAPTGVTATWSNGVDTYDGFVDQGFIFDIRLDVALDGSDVWLMTPAGLIHGRDLSRVAPLAHAASRQQLIGRGDTFFYGLSADGAWARFAATSWSPVANPDLNRLAATDRHLEWRFVDGALQVTRPDAGQAAAMRDGLRFDADVLEHAALAPGKLVYVQSDGTREVSSFNQLGDIPRPVAAAPSQIAHLDARPMADGTTEIVTIGPDGRIGSVWTGNGYRPVAAPENPDIQRLAASGDWLRVRFERNRPVAELHLLARTGERIWSAIDWPAGAAMPFDSFTALHAANGRLYAGTPVGLQILDLQGSTIRTQQFIDTRSGSGASYDPVQRIGESINGGGRVFVSGARSCLEILQDTPSDCSEADPLQWEALGGNTFWHWVRFNGQVSYFYLDSAKNPIGRLLQAPRAGRFPHDNLDDLASCRGAISQSWNGVVTALSARGGLRSAVSEAVDPDTRLALYCHRHTTPASDTEPQGLPAGFYVLGKTTWTWAGGTATPQAGLDEAARSRASGMIAHENDRLRVVNVTGRRGVSFQYRRGSTWEPLQTAEGRLAIDRRDGLVFAEGTVWAYTPAGFVSIRDQTGHFDPDALQISRAVGAKAPKCQLDAAETADGRSSFIPRPAEGPRTFLRCMDGRILAGRLDANSTSRMFDPIDAASDPFIGREIFDDGVIAITRSGRKAGQPGNLGFTWRKEDNPLAGGRFALDRMRNMARIDPRTLDIVTDLGWVRQNHDDWRASGARRPDNHAGLAREAVSIALDSDIDSRPASDPSTTESLCVLRKDGTSGRWYPDGRFEAGASCGKLLGHDGSYAYRLVGNATRMTGHSRNAATLTRKLVDGRFSDHALAGHAVLSHADGAPAVAIATDGQIAYFDASNGRQLPGWAWNGAASALTLAPDGDVAVLSDTGMRSLEGTARTSCESLAADLSALPEGRYSLRGITFDRQTAYIQMTIDNKPLEARTDCRQARGLSLSDSAALADRTRYQANAERWGRPDPSLVLGYNVSEGGVSLLAAMDPKRVQLSENLGFPLLLRRIDDRFVLVTQDDVFEADLDTLTQHVQEEARQ
ncbi:hypothetical protein [Stappia indica]|uniref:Uncharacterized protein n=1 Tax=Stappia indica TaxID=538381 RepID=A0A857CCH5_9HYPH|nr:hypothetical protein [Stappia indica]QGZ36720.1 hypothetical protein GH266_20795 [Stappia indica]